MQVLAGDIGGTKALLALVEVDTSSPATAPRARVLESRRYDSHAHPGLESICRAFAADLGRELPRRAGFGIAGPVANGRSIATNLPWVTDEEDLKARLGAEQVVLVNDFVALGQGLAFLQPADLLALNEGVRVPGGLVAVLGAGTGLGEALVMTDRDGRREVLPTEGGHACFAPRNEVEIALLRFLLTRYDHVSWERVLSGDGLVNIAEGLAAHEGGKLPLALAEKLESNRAGAPAVVTDLARAGDALCIRTLQIFCSLYGAEAGNLALKSLPAGGIFVAGGIAPRITAELSDGRFRQAFLDKGRMRHLLTTIPVHVVLDPLTPLYGAAALATAAPQKPSN